MAPGRLLLLLLLLLLRQLMLLQPPCANSCLAFVVPACPACQLHAGRLSSQHIHPWDPHKPSFNPLLPTPYRPYPSFEGWFLRLVDFSHHLSVGAIMATNYATSDSQITLLFSFPHQKYASAGHTCAHHGSVASRLEPGRTYVFYARSKDGKFTQHPLDEEIRGDVASHEPKGFEWEAPNLGRIVAKPHATFMNVTLEGYTFTSKMFKEVSWDASDSGKGPEGWARKLPLLPTNWYIYSLGSEATYELINEEEGLYIKGYGLAHQEKNWGETFPAGHVWLQAFSPDNRFQVSGHAGQGAYFRLGDNLKTPYIFVMGYRSPQLRIDMRTNDPGVIFKDIMILPSKGKISVTAVGPSHTIKINCAAPPESFSDPLLCPIGKLSWEPACRESYFAHLEVEVFEHVVWGVVGNQIVVERQAFEFAALEFGEDLLKEADE